MLTAEGLVLAFGQIRALRGVDVAVEPGEILAVTGPSGAGKSTLLHVLAGVLVPDGGTVHYGGQCLNELRDDTRSRIRLRHFGFVSQAGDLIPELSLRENVELPLRLLGRPRDPVEPLLKEFDVAGVADRLPGQVSGGQAQRAVVARALVHDPDLVFADEPTGALDSADGELVLDALTGAARRRNTTVVLFTHEARTAAYADRAVFLHDGRLGEQS